MSKFLSALRKYDPHIEWSANDLFISGNSESVEWMLFDEIGGFIQREEGIYKQVCDFGSAEELPKLMRAMDAAAVAINEAMK